MGTRKISSMSAAMQWVARITNIGLEMALPTLLGYWLDGQLGTSPWLLVVGALLGFGVGMLHLLSMAGGRGGGGRR